MFDILYDFTIHFLEFMCDLGIMLALSNIKWSEIRGRKLLWIPCNCIICTIIWQLCKAPTAVILCIISTIIIVSVMLKITVANSFYAYLFTYSLLDLAQIIIILILPQNTLALFSVYVEI